MNMVTGENVPPACRICHRKSLNKIFEIANMPLTDDFIDVSNQRKAEYIADIKIFNCPECGVVQNPFGFSELEYYREYQYSSGHSKLTKRFMNAYARVVIQAFESVHGHKPLSVLEVGSGDGEQLQIFKELGADIVIGVEPSEYLAKKAVENGINTVVDLFDSQVTSKVSTPIELCVSSYTLDHVPSPLDFLQTAYHLLIDGGILALEVHDFEKIVARTEYCLFEHEHTVYLTKESIEALLTRTGFSLLSVNPLSESITRGNSLLVIAKKGRFTNQILPKISESDILLYSTLQHRVLQTIERIETWVSNLHVGEELVGFGAGGRGIMTVASLVNYRRFSAILDSNYNSSKFLAPKTRLPIVGPDTWGNYSHSHCLIFSYGYFYEIEEVLIRSGFKKSNIHSLMSFYPDTSNPEA